MNEQEYIDLIIVKSLANQATRQELIELKNWLEESQNNREYCYLMREIWHSTHSPFNPDSIDTEVAEQLFWHKAQKKHFDSKKLLLYWQKIAAIIVLPLFFVAGYLIYDRTVEDSFVVMQELKVPFGTQIMTQLPDGSEVWLNSGSKLVYPTHFTSRVRKVQLSGEGYFKVKSDAEHPFVVHTPHLAVEAVGTEFNVEAFDTDSITAVSMINGVVNVKLRNGENVSMRKDNRLVVHNHSGKAALSSSPTYKWCSWKDGVLLFRNDKLDYVFKRLNQIYNIDIQVEDTIILSYPYRATFKEESLDQIFNLLELSAPIRFEWTHQKSKEGEHETKVRVYKE